MWLPTEEGITLGEVSSSAKVIPEVGETQSFLPVAGMRNKSFILKGYLGSTSQHASHKEQFVYRTDTRPGLSGATQVAEW